MPHRPGSRFFAYVYAPFEIDSQPCLTYLLLYTSIEELCLASLASIIHLSCLRNPAMQRRVYCYFSFLLFTTSNWSRASVARLRVSGQEPPPHAGQTACQLLCAI